MNAAEIDRIADEYFTDRYEKFRQADWFCRMSAAQQEACLADGRRSARSMAEKLVGMIEAKDIRLLELTLHRENRVSCAAFTRITGLPLGRTNKSIRETVRQYVGPETYDTFQAEREKARRERAEAFNKKRQEDIVNARLGQTVTWTYRERRDDGTVVSGLSKSGARREFIDWLVDEGYQPVEAKRGFRKVLHMCKDGVFFRLETKIECVYALQRLTDRAAAVRG